MNGKDAIKELKNLPTTVYAGFYQLRITHNLRDKVVKLHRGCICNRILWN